MNQSMDPTPPVYRVPRREPPQASQHENATRDAKASKSSNESLASLVRKRHAARRLISA